MTTKTPPPVTSCVHSADMCSRRPPLPKTCHCVTRRIPSSISLFTFSLFITSLPLPSFSVARCEFVRRPALLPLFSGSYEDGKPFALLHKASKLDFLDLTPYLNCDPHKSFHVVFTNNDRAACMAMVNVLTSWLYAMNVGVSKLIRNTVMQRQSTLSL